MSRMTSTGQGAERTTWQRSARATPGAWRRTRSPSGRRSWRRRTRPSARRWPTCGRSWASARTYSPSTRPGTGPCRTMAFGAGAGWGEAGLCLDGHFVSCLTAPHPNQPSWHQHFTRGISTAAPRVGVCARARLCLCSRVWFAVCARARPFLCTCYFQIALSPSFSSEKERCHVFTGLWSPLVGFPAPPTSPAPALSMLLRVRSYPLFQDPLLGVTDKGPGKTVDLSFQDDKLLFLFNL